MKQRNNRIRVGVAFLEERFGKHRNTIRRWSDSGKFLKPNYDPSGYRSWFLDEVEAWEAENYPQTNPLPKNANDALEARKSATSNNHGRGLESSDPVFYRARC